MRRPLTPGFFIAGTSTDVGKTYVAAMIVRHLSAAGRRVGVYKPVASGCRRTPDGVVADDAVRLWDAAGRPDSLDAVCPQRFLAPVAPHRAAIEEGKRVDSDLLRLGFEHWRRQSDIVVVEGAGGLMSPVSDVDYCLDLAIDLTLPLVIVAENQLGVINAAMQTLITASARAPKLPIIGVVLNQSHRRSDDESLKSNAVELAARLPAPLLATVGYDSSAFEPSVNWSSLARKGESR